MLAHHVLFQLKNPTDDASRTEFIEALGRFGAEAPFAVGTVEIRDLRLGTGNERSAPVSGAAAITNGEPPRTAHASISVRFAGGDDFLAYLTSDPHTTLLRDVVDPLCELWWGVEFEE